ncbi:MAG: hypothetical protein ACOYLE_04190 [Bacteroidales bacterium]
METEEEIMDVLKQLSKKRSIFHSEADFQHELAIILREIYSPKYLRLEKPMSIDEKDKHLDIYIETIDNKRIAIELKYRTKFFHEVIYNEVYSLKNHSATGSARYSFIKDISRIEKMRKDRLIDFGYAIILTNDTAIYKTEKNPSERQKRLYLMEGKELEGEIGFDIPDDKTKEQIKKQYGEKQFPINLSGTYKIKWLDFSLYLKCLIVKIA